MKKIYLLLMAAVLVFALAGCGIKDKVEQPVQSQGPGSQTGTEDIETVQDEDKIWQGEWERFESTMYDDALLSITNEQADSFEFSINANSGANIGEIVGSAKIDGNKALFEDKETNSTLQFEYYKGVVTISFEGELAMYAGAGVGFDGDYGRAPQKKEMNLTQLGVFADETQEAEFKRLTGESYSSFLNSYHIIMEGEDLDGFDAHVYSGGVRGLFTIMEGIIMYNDAGEYWAAVIEDDKVLYFTNTQLLGQLPKTIDHWRENFKDKEIVYMN